MMSRHIGVAAFFRPDQQAGGVYSVFRNLLSGLAEVSLAEQAYRDVEITVFHNASMTPMLNNGVCWKPVPSRWGRFAAESWIGAIESYRLDAVLFPNYFLPPIRRGSRDVVVLHDLLYRHFPGAFSPRKRWWLDKNIRRTLAHADHVVTISHAVKQDVLRHFGEIYSDKITPIWNPIDLTRFEPSEGELASQSPIDRPYLLSVAIDRPQKNLATLLRAFAQVKDSFPEHDLVLVGQLRSQRSATAEEAADLSRRLPSAVELVDSLGLCERVRVTGFVSDARLGQLYRGAALFVMPTLFEGFGMPAIEAIALGCPTLVSDLPPLREITCGLAGYIADPLDPHAMADQIAACLSSPDSARPSPEDRDALASRFSAKKVALQYLDVLFENSAQGD